jgi:hypothetical protein
MPTQTTTLWPMMAIVNLVDDPSEIVLFQQEFSKEIHDNIYAILTPLVYIFWDK